jgi:hypothetical protein
MQTMNSVATMPAAASAKHYSISQLPHCSHNLSQLQTWLLSKAQPERGPGRFM